MLLPKLRYCLALGMGLIAPIDGSAAAFSFFGAEDAKYSHAVAAAGVGAGTKIALTGAGLKVGAVIVGGSLALSGIDPPGGTFYTGSFTYHYDSALFELVEFGWLGGWGIDPSEPTLPIDDTFWPGVEVILQQPNAGLSASVSHSPEAGEIDVSFDWGPSGFNTGNTDPLNIAGVLLRARSDLIVQDVVTNGGIGALQEVSTPNLFVEGISLSCSIDDGPIVHNCGSEATTGYVVGEVPEPQTWALLVAGFGLLGWLFRMWGREAASAAG